MTTVRGGGKGEDEEEEKEEDTFADDCVPPRVIAMIGGRGKGVGGASSKPRLNAARLMFTLSSCFDATLKLIYLRVGKWGKFGLGEKVANFDG